MFAPRPSVRSQMASRRVAGCVELLDVDRVVGAELLGEGQALRQPVEHDHLVRAHILGHRGGVEPEAARALNHDEVVLLAAGAHQALGDGAHRAVDEAQNLVGQVVGHLEDGVVGLQVVVVGVGAGEVRRHAGLARPGGAVGAPVPLAARALVAAPAGGDRGVHHAVAELKRAAQRVGADAVAQRVDHAGALVAHDAPALGQRVGDHVAAPGVQVGAADPGLCDPQHDPARLRVGDRILLDHERLLVFLDDNDASCGHGGLLREFALVRRVYAISSVGCVT